MTIVSRWRRAGSVVMLFAVIVMANVTSLRVSANWSPAIDLSAPGQSAVMPEITSSADGTRLTAIWSRYDGANFIVQTRTSTDSGANWSPVIDLSAPGQSADAPQVTSSTDGTRLTAIWSRYDFPNWIVQTRTSTDSGANWSSVIDLSAPGQSAVYPQVTSSTDGTRLTAIWYRFDGANVIVQTRTSTDSGANWSSVIDLSAPGQSAAYPQVTSSADGTRLTAIWYRLDGANFIVQTRTSTDSGANWSPVIDLSAPGQSADVPQVTSSTDGTRLTAIWRVDGANFSVQTRTSTDSGANWSPVIDLSAPGKSAV